MDASTTRTSTPSVNTNPFVVASEIIAVATGIMGLLSMGVASLGQTAAQHEQKLKDSRP